MTLALNVNGTIRNVEASPLARLLDVLRELGLSGTKEGCGEGECGACTVLLDGEPANACLVLAGQAQGLEITTIEGLGGTEGTPAHLTPLQRLFVVDGATQCGICTPGMILSAEALLRRDASPSEQAIRTAMAGNLCRCTGYQRIVEAVKHAAELRASDRGEE